MSSRRKMLMDQLFEKWDNDGSGYLDQDEVENVMMKYKDGQESEAIEKGKNQTSYSVFVMPASGI